MSIDTFFDQAALDSWLAEDVPFFDLTSHVLGLGDRPARMTIECRQPITLACSEEGARLVEQLGGQVRQCLPSASQVAAGTPLLVAEGPAGGLLRAWKVAQNLLEYACGVASATRHLRELMARQAPRMALLTTRKHPPGLRRICLKAILAGGAMPHRLGLGETVLVFPQHRSLLDGWEEVRQRLEAHREWLCEKKVIIEAGSLEEARQAIAAGAHVVQFDKVDAAHLTDWVRRLRLEHPAIGLLAAGGIHVGNVAAYAASGVDALVTSSPYAAAPADLGVRFEALR